MGKLEYSLVLFAFVAATSAGPAGLRPEDGGVTFCSQTCTESSKFNYAVGSTYEYKYDVETRTSVLGASQDTSIIGISAIATVEILSKCEHVLKISKVTIDASDSKKLTNQDSDGEFAKGLETYPLRFSFQDGGLESVCPHDSEKPWALNIKKGLLSSFQNTMEGFQTDHNGTESDVAGKCKTEYKVAQTGWRSVTLKKHKDMDSCTNRNGFNTALHMVPFTAGLKSLDILKGTYECDQTISTQGLMTSSHCHELQLFRPFSKEGTGAATETTQKLTFIQQRNSVSRNAYSAGKPQELFFDHDQVVDKFDLVPREALLLLKDMCQWTMDDIKMDTPAQFSTLVHLMKRMDAAGLKRIYNQVHKPSFCDKNAERIKKFVTDALPMVGTAPSVELMKTLISNDVVTGRQADMWLASITFIHKPTSDMIEQVLQLTGIPSLSTKVLLPLSTLVHAYCRVNPDCESVREVREVTQLLERNIGDGCVADQTNFKKIMMSLRGLGNTGHADSATKALDTCINNQDNSMDIRVAAVQAFRRMSCNVDRSNLMDVFGDNSADFELRINAYLEVIRCPSPEIVSRIKQILYTLEFKQVGSFVWTHLTNLMESNDPANKYVQQLLNDEILEKEFDLEKLKFSRNYEASVFIERFNAGAKFDSNVIFSDKSFVPRSASLNLTFNLFGESMNLFEFGGRVEGLEHLLESYFGTAGYFNDKDKSNNEVPQANAKLARLSSSKLGSIHEKSKKMMDDLRGAVYTRMFGNEISYNMFGANNGIDQEMSKSDMFEFLKKLRNNEKQDLSMTKSLVFLDSMYTVPTIAGLPLNLNVNGTSTVALKADGQIDMKNPKSKIVIEGMFEPSGAVQIDSMMSVDAFVTKGGMKMTSTLYTSTGAKTKIELTNGNVFDLSFDLTKEKSEIIKVQTSFFMVHNEMEREQRMIVIDRYEQSDCSGNRVLKATGLRLCASVSGPNSTDKDNAPNFPFTGPMTMAVLLEKKDLPNGYKMEAKTIKTPDQMLFRFLSNTPGSTHDRAIGLDVDFQQKQKTLDINFLSPWKKASMKGELIDKPKVKGIIGTIDVDESTRVYKLDAKILIERLKDSTSYTPTITLEVPDWKNVYLTGRLNYKQKESFDADLTVTGAMDHPIKLVSTVQNTDTQVGMKSSLKWDDGEGYTLEAMSDGLIFKTKLSRKHTYSPRLYVRGPVKELIDMTGNIIYTEGKLLKVDGKLDKLFESPITLTGTVLKSGNTKKKQDQYQGTVTVQMNKKFIKFTHRLLNKNWLSVNNKMRLEYNFGRKVKDTIIMGTNFKTNSKYTNVKIKSTFNSLRNNDIDASFVATYNGNKLKNKLASTLKYGINYKKKATKDRIDFSYITVYSMKKVQKAINYTMNLKLPAKEVDVSLAGGYRHDGQSIHNDVTFSYHPKRSVSLNLKLHNKTNDFPHYAGQIDIGLPEGREMFFAGAFGKESEDKYVSNLEFEIIKGRSTKLDAMLKIATDNMYEVELGMELPELEPVRVRGAYIKEEDGFKTEASFKRGGKLYSISGEALCRVGSFYKLELDTKVPERRVKLLLDSSHVKSMSHNMIDIQWDADNNLEDRFLINVTNDFKDWNDFELASTLYYPSRTIEFNMKHSASARYITSAELSWSPKDKMEVKIIFRDDEFNGADRTELSVEFFSPFEDYEELGLAVSIISDTSQYQTKSSVTWGKKKKILVSASAKFPMTANSIDIAGTITTPFKSYRKMVATMKHRFSDALDTSILIDWGRQRLVTNVKSTWELSAIKRSFTGNLEVRTPFEGLRIYLLSAEHNDDGRKFSSRLESEITVNSTQETGYKYIVEMDMTHDQTVAILDNKGTLEVTIPQDYFSTIWEVKAQLGQTHLLFDILPQRGNRFKVAFDETHQFKPYRKFYTSFELLIPMEEVKELNAVFAHEDKDNYLKTETTITKDKEEMYFEKIVYERNPGHIQFDTVIRSVYTEDIIVKMVSSHTIMPYNVHMSCQWSPYQIIDVNTYLFYDNFGTFDASVDLKTPFPRAKVVKFTTQRLRKGLNWEVNAEVEFAPRQKVSVETVYRIDHVKLTSVSIRTPFPQFSNLDASFRIDGNALKLDGEAEIQVLPYLNKLSTNFNWAYYEGTSLKGEFNLNTPFPEYPYMKAKVDSNMLGMSRLSILEVEYLPTQVVKIESDYRFTSLDTLRGTIKVTSPYTENKEVVASFTHIGDREEFTTDAKITCECFERAAFTKATFSSKDAIGLTFVMDSPFKGYETVNLKFNHRGEPEDFHTNLEYETNGETLSLESVFNIKTNVELQMTLLTPFVNMTRSHFELTHTGTFPNTRTQTEIAFNNREGHSDINLSHDALSTVLSVVVTTPFERYETITCNVMRQGDIKDFKAEGELQYDQLWKATYSHMLSKEHITSSALFTSPLLEEDFRFEFNQTNKMDDFSSSTIYSMGSAYTSTSEIILKTNDLPNLEFKVKTDTTMKDEKKSNELQLLNAVDGRDNYFKLYAIVPKVFADIEMTMKWVEETVDLDSHLILELPIESLASTSIFYTATMESDNDKKSSKTEFTMDTTMLEHISMVQTEVQDAGIQSGQPSFHRNTVSRYGDQFYTEDAYFDMKKLSMDYASSFEGYENASLLLEYSGSIVDQRNQNKYKYIENIHDEGAREITKGYYSSIVRPATLSVVGTFTCSGLPGPITGNYDMKLDDENEHKLQLELPYDDFKSTNAMITYEYTDQLGMDFSLDSTAMIMPIKASSNLRHTSLVDFEMIAVFTSGFENFTDMDLVMRTSQEPSAAYKPYLKVTWQEQSQMIEVDGMYKWTQLESGDTNLGAGIAIKTPFDVIKEVNFQYNYEVALSPLMLKESVIAQYNEEKYVDFDAEFSALNTFNGNVIFRAPRPMTYILTAENQGESVNGDLLLNWNENNPDSFFRLQFGLSDSGDLTVMNKTFLIRVTRPDRIVGIRNQLVRSNNKIISEGRVAWDEQNSKHASYDLTYTLNEMNTHDAVIKVIVPSRSVEVSGSFKDSVQEIMGAGTVLWDAENDRDKRVEVKLNLSPNSVKKTGALLVTLPSVNKKLSLNSMLVIGEGRQIFGGQTEFSYSPSDDKSVILDYAILHDDIRFNNYRVTWSVKHKETKTYINMNTLVTANDFIASSNMNLKYRKNNGQVETMTLKGEANVKDRKMFIKMITPDDSAELSGLVTDESPYIITLSTHRNDAVTWMTVWSVDTRERTLDASMTYGGNSKKISTKAFLPTDKSFMSKTERITEDGTVQEGQLSAELEYRKLHGHIKWRPELVKDVMTFSSNCMKDLITELSDIIETSSEVFGAEMLGKWKRLRASMSQELAPFMDSLDAELKEFQKELRNMRRELKKMYKENDLYMKTIDEMYNGAVKKLMTSYSKTISKVGEVYKTVEEKMEEMSNQISEYPIKEKCDEMIEEVKATIEKTKETVRNEIDMIFNTLRKNVKMVFALYDEAMNDISMTTQKYVAKLAMEVLVTPQLDLLKKSYANLTESLGPNMEATKAEIENLINQVQEIITAALKDGDWVKKYQMVYKKTQAILSENFGMDEISNEILKTLEDIHKQVAIIYKYMTMEMSTEVLEEVIQMVREKMMEEFNQLPLGLLDLHKSQFQTFDLENGEIEFDLYLPIPMENFEKLMRFTFNKYMKRLNKMAMKYFPRRDFVLSDFYYRFTPVQWSMKRDWVPPFDAIAVVAGKQHYTTFDGYHISMAGLCSYVLATDIVDGNFTIVQKYTGGPRRFSRDSLVVMIHGTTIELFSDYKIQVDGQPRELPYITDHVELVRSGSHIKLTSKYGVEVIADFERDFHIIGLSGWYFGKVAGILGSYDNEPINDKMSPLGVIEHDTRRFMNSWEVGASCKSSRSYAVAAPRTKTEVCANVFTETSSTLRPCFLQIDPLHYQRSCDLDQSSLCNLATLYSRVCSRSGITVSLPTQCMTCDDNKGSTFQSGETLKYEGQGGQSPQQESGDVVMIVEAKQCNRDVIDKLTSVVYEMDQSLNRAGSYDNRFSLLGYTEDHVYQHTMEGQMFNAAPKFAMAIESLKLSSSGSVADPFKAIQAAVGLPFRAGVAKVFVLVSCMPCEQNEYQYRVLSNDLEQRDITLHVLRKTGFHLKTNRSPNSLIYGYTKDQLITGLSRQAKPDNHEDVVIPADYCSTLAVSTNGSIFDSSHVLSGQVRKQKDFMKAVGDRIVVKDEATLCQMCTCEVGGYGLPQSVCRRCDAQSLYLKHLPDVMSSVVELKNGLTSSLQRLF